MAADDVDMDPAAVDAAAARLRDSGSRVAQHGSDLDTATSGRRIGRGGALASAVEDLAKRGLSAVAHGATQAVKRLHDDTATGLERAAKRTRTRDADAKQSFDKLGNTPSNLHSGGPIPVAGHSGGKGGSPTPSGPQVKPPHSPDLKKWQDAGGKVKFHSSGKVTYTTGGGSAHSKVGAGVSITYDKRGNPDFRGHLTHPSGVTHVTFPSGYSGNRGSDFRESNKMAAQIARKEPWTTKGDVSPPGYTWHHHHDLHTMQLVDRNVHQLFSHLGGVSLMKGKGKP
jgi:hypothetical protein